MPAKNIIKRFTPETFYHIYNRGVEKRIIFHDDQDRKKFLNLFDRYLNENNDEVDQNNIRYPKFGNQIQIHSYALMDNHFHLLIKTGTSAYYISEFMKSICGSYTQYFNKRYERIGPLYQGKYKALPVLDEQHLLTECKYINLNPKNDIQKYFSSLYIYLGLRPAQNWMTTEDIFNLVPLEEFAGLLYPQKDLDTQAIA